MNSVIQVVFSIRENCLPYNVIAIFISRERTRLEIFTSCPGATKRTFASVDPEGIGGDENFCFEKAQKFTETNQGVSRSVEKLLQCRDSPPTKILAVWLSRPSREKKGMVKVLDSTNPGRSPAIFLEVFSIYGLLQAIWYETRSKNTGGARCQRAFCLPIGRPSGGTYE